MKENKKVEQPSKFVRKYGMLLIIPFMLGVCPLVGFFLGWILDKILNIRVMSIIFLFIGLAAGARESYLIIRRASQNND